ncbi:TonB-dependent receptor [Pleionea sediminis]|uniref:TonB-dependent receptor n=1 Tax=Pleionea sediminis TaxID=2569479 RepID=UPI001184AAD7|nr:TonB-dependent receptor [Pleionea sediminis]
MNKTFLFSFKKIPILLSLSLVASSPFLANAAEEEEKENKIQIIGSHIKRSDAEGPSPVTIFDREDLDRSGYNNVHQFLERLPSIGSGTFSTEGNSQDSTANGGAGVSLRGFGSDATLVLINGRRVTISSFAESVVNNFVDINSIPMSAVEQIQILKDGASAIYGSDAVAGVINVVLRRDFVSSEVSLGYGNTTDTDADERTVSGVFGFGDSVSNATLIIDHFSNTALMNIDRGSLGTANQEPFGGMDFRSSRGFPGRYIVNGVTTIDPDCPADRAFGATCVFDYGPYSFLVPAAERTGMMFIFDRELASGVEIFGEVSFQHNTSEAGGAPTPLDGDAGLTVPSTHPNNPFGVDIAIDRHRTVDAGPRRWDIETDNMRFVAGVRGFIGVWDWELSAQKGRSRSLQTGTKSQGWVRTDLLQQEIDAGRYNPFGGTYNPASVIDAITTNLTRLGESHLTAFEGKSSGELFEMDSGMAALAVGFEYRDEKVIDSPDDQFQRGLIFGTESISAKGARDHWAAYTELSLPLTLDLELQLAVRHDDYSDFGSSTNPKVALRWTAQDNLSLRASWGTGFRAPSLSQVGLGPSQESRFFEDTYCNPNISPSTASFCSSPVGASTDYTIIFSGNPDLQAEESESVNIGVIWDISNTTNFSVDVWNITQDNKIDEGDVGLVYDLYCNPDPAEFDDRFCTRNPITNELSSVNNSFFNLTSQEASGVDFVFNHQMVLDGSGTINFNLDYMFLSKFEKDDRDWTGEYEFPEHRWIGRVEWTMNAWTAIASINYIGEFEDTPDIDFDGSLDFDQNKSRTVDAMTTVNVQVQYDTELSTTYSFGVRNLFDEEPPFAIGDGNNDLFGYVSGVHNPRGQFIFGKATYRF